MVAGLFLFGLRSAPITDDGFTVCLLKNGIGHPCPGCGGTRALHALAQGDLAHSLRYHPFAALLAVEALAVWLLWGAVLGARAVGSRAMDWALRWRQALGPWAGVHATALLALWVGRTAVGALPW